MFTSTVTSFLLLALYLSSTSAQFFSSLPGCVQTCLSNSQDEICSTFDVACFCRAAGTGDFLTDALTCIHTQCDSDMDANILLTPLKLACGLVGTPIPKAVLSSAEARGSSLATETAPATATTGVNEYSTPVPAAASTTDGSSISTTTSTQSAAASTSSPSRSGTHTSTSTHTVTSSIESSSSISGAPQSSFSTDLASKTSSSSETSSKTSAAPDGGNTDSAPFTNTNDAPNVVGNVGTWFALTIAMAAGFALVLS